MATGPRVVQFGGPRDILRPAMNVPTRARNLPEEVPPRGAEVESKRVATMKKLFGTIAAAALLALPINAMAQHGGGMGGRGGGMGGHGGMGGWHGGGWGGHFHGGHFHSQCCGFFPFFGGFGLGFAAAYPWYYWGYPGYYWGPPSSYYYGGPYDGDGDGYPDGNYGGHSGAPPASSAPQACGKWVWRTDQNHYQWIPEACATTPAAPPPT